MDRVVQFHASLHSLFSLSKKVCFGLRWLRGNDNDSIGEDDRRGGQPNGVHHYANNNVGLESRRHRGIRQEYRPAAGRAEPIIVPPRVVKCSRADVVTHLGITKKLQTEQRLEQDRCSSIQDPSKFDQRGTNDVQQ